MTSARANVAATRAEPPAVQGKRGHGSDMGRVEAEARPKITDGLGIRIRQTDWLLALRRLLFVLFLADVVVAESQLSILAKTGAGANHVVASPSLIALLLLASFGVAVLLRWQRVCGGILAAWQSLAHLPVVGGRRIQHTLQRHDMAHTTSQAIQRTLDRWRLVLLASTLRHWISVILAGAALLASVLAAAFVSGPIQVLAAQWFWLAGVGLLLAAAWAWPSPRISPLRRLRWRLSVDINARDLPRWQALWSRWGDWLLVSALVGIGLALRLPNLATMPYVVHGDEASCALEALRWLHGEVHTLLSTGWYGLPVAGYGIPALVMRFAGEDLFGLRLSSVIVGTLSLILLYLLAREFSSRRVAFVATALMTVSHLHIQFSRSGIHYIHALFAVELTIWLLVRALRDRSAIAAVLAAVAISLSTQVYFSARLVYIIVPLFIVGMLLLNRGLLAGRASTFAWLAAGLATALGPLAAYFSANSNPLNSRTNEVLILNLTPYMRSHLIGEFGTADLRTVLLRQLAAVPLIPTGIADQSTQYGPHYSLLDVAMATLVTIGFFYALLRLRQPLFLLLSLWIAGTVVFGGILTMDMPDWQRLLVMLPALCLLAALVLEDLLRRVEQGVSGLARWLPALHMPDPAAVLAATLLALALVAFNASWNIQRYFVDYPRLTNSDPWWTTYTDIGRYLGTLPAGTHFILFSDGDLVADYATLRYLGPGTKGTRVESTADLALALAQSHGSTVVIVTQSHLADVGKAMVVGNKLPPGTFAPYVTANHQTTFYVFTPARQSPSATTDAP
ncbi:MAG TPA: glycosyltransferase family 39 protein [Ktedonobacterales bacterium]|nr:glycosyltransferase family 39 protein [Ktedonobacterales bacterium]